MTQNALGRRINAQRVRNQLKPMQHRCVGVLNAGGGHPTILICELQIIPKGSLKHHYTFIYGFID